ncbi:MAG: mannosyltransferase family protein [Chloroflexota bacterium]
MFVLTRVAFVLLAYFGYILFKSILHGPHPSFTHQLLPAWNRWDSVWYTDIAQRGYGWRRPAGTSPTAFFPLYPLLIHVVMVVTRRSALVSALAISNACFLGALLYLWRLTKWELNEDTARRATLYIATFPTALFFFAGYTESLFLLVTVACFYYMRRREWFVAGVCIGLASATRVTGILLLVPLAYEYARHCNFRPRQMLASGLLGLLIAPSGLLAFMLYLWRVVDDPFAFSHNQAAWQKVFTPRIWAGLVETLRQIFVIQPGASFYEAHNLLNLGAAAMFLCATFVVARRLPASYTLYLVGFWLITLSDPAVEGGYPVPLISMSRYVLSLFPVFMYLGVLGGRRWFHDGYLVVSTALLALLTLQFVTGGWVV